jgi:hypothetical protein
MKQEHKSSVVSLASPLEQTLSLMLGVTVGEELFVLGHDQQDCLNLIIDNLK